MCVCVFAFPRLPCSAGFDRVCSLAGAHCTLLSLPLVPSSPLLLCSANKSLFLSHSFFYSLCSRLSWRGKTFPQLSQSPLKPPPSPFLSPPLSQSITPPPFLPLSHSLLFCLFLVSTSLLCLPLFPFFSFFSLYPSPSSFSVSLSPPVPWQTLASHDPHSHLCPDPATHKHTHVHIHVHHNMENTGVPHGGSCLSLRAVNLSAIHFILFCFYET